MCRKASEGPFLLLLSRLEDSVNGHRSLQAPKATRLPVCAESLGNPLTYCGISVVSVLPSGLSLGEKHFVSLMFELSRSLHQGKRTQQKNQTLKCFKTVIKYSHSFGAAWETEARRCKRLSLHLLMGILTRVYEIQIEPQVALGGESSERSSALEPVLQQPRAALGQDRTLSRLNFFPVKMTDGCFKIRKYHLGLVHWPGGSCAFMNHSPHVFKIGYKMLLITLGDEETIAKIRCVVIRTVCMAIFWNWHCFFFFFTYLTESVWISLFFTPVFALLSLPHPCLGASPKVLSIHPGQRSLHPLQWEPG